MKIDSTTLILLLAGVVVVYFVTRPAVPAAPVYAAPVYNPLQASGYGGNQTAQDVAAGGQAAGTVINALSNIF